MSGEKIDSNRQNENLKLLPNNELENFDILNDKLDYGPTGISPRCRVSSFDNNEFDPEDFSAYMNGRRTLLGDSEEIDLNIYGEIDDAPKGETSNNYEYDAILDSNNFGYENLDNEEIYKSPIFHNRKAPLDRNLIENAKELKHIKAQMEPSIGDKKNNRNVYSNIKNNKEINISNTQISSSEKKDFLGNISDNKVSVKIPKPEECSQSKFLHKRIPNTNESSNNPYRVNTEENKYNTNTNYSPKDKELIRDFLSNLRFRKLLEQRRKGLPPHIIKSFGGLLGIDYNLNNYPNNPIQPREQCTLKTKPPKVVKKTKKKSNTNKSYVYTPPICTSLFFKDIISHKYKTDSENPKILPNLKITKSNVEKQILLNINQSSKDNDEKNLKANEKNSKNDKPRSGLLGGSNILSSPYANFEPYDSFRDNENIHSHHKKLKDIPYDKRNIILGFDTINELSESISNNTESLNMEQYNIGEKEINDKVSRDNIINMSSEISSEPNKNIDLNNYTKSQESNKNKYKIVAKKRSLDKNYNIEEKAIPRKSIIDEILKNKTYEPHKVYQDYKNFHIDDLQSIAALYNLNNVVNDVMFILNNRHVQITHRLDLIKKRGDRKKNL